MLHDQLRINEFQVKVYSSIESISFEQWKEIPGKILPYDYLKFIEESKPVDLTFLYVLIEKEVDGKTNMCGAMYFQSLKTSRKNFNFKNNFLIKFFSGLLFSIKSFNILICGNLFAVNFPSIWFNNRLIEKKDILNIADSIGKKIKCKIILLKDLDSEFQENEMHNSGWKPYTADLTMQLTIEAKWTSINTYIENLNKKYRKRALKILKSGKELHRKVMSVNDVMMESNRIFDLFNQVAERQTIRMGIIRRDYFLKYLNVFPDSFSIIGYYYKERLIAFSTFIDRGETLEMHYIGMDYSFNKKFMLYFNLLQDGIEKAIDLNKKFLELGRTAREAKANLGSIPIYFNDYYKSRGRITNFITEKIITYCQKLFNESTINRNPVKK